MPRIERVQYDSTGAWLDVVFDDGRRARFSSSLVFHLARIVWDTDAAVVKVKEQAAKERLRDVDSET